MSRTNIKKVDLFYSSNLGEFEGELGETSVYDKVVASFIITDDEWGYTEAQVYKKVGEGYVIREYFWARKSACPPGIWNSYEASFLEVLEKMEKGTGFQFF